jgi:hypothetical protein
MTSSLIGSSGKALFELPPNLGRVTVIIDILRASDILGLNEILLVVLLGLKKSTSIKFTNIL